MKPNIKQVVASKLGNVASSIGKATKRGIKAVAKPFITESNIQKAQDQKYRQDALDEEMGKLNSNSK